MYCKIVNNSMTEVLWFQEILLLEQAKKEEATEQFTFLSFLLSTGENGEPVVLTSEEKTNAESSVHDYGFNMVVSDKISMTRTIPDTRLDEYVHSYASSYISCVSALLQLILVHCNSPLTFFRKKNGTLAAVVMAETCNNT